MITEAAAAGATAPAGSRPEPAGFARGALRVAAFSLSRTLFSFRTWGLLLFGALPALLLGLRGVLFEIDEPVFRNGDLFFHFVFVMAIVQFFLLFCSVLLGASAFSEEVEDQTLVYLFSRPMPRAAVFLGKLAASIVVLAGILSATALAAWAMRGGRFGAGSTENVPATLVQAIQCCGILALGATTYASAFAAIGTFLKKPLLVGILIAFGWEVVVSNIPGVIPSVTVMYYLRSIFVEVFGPLPLPIPEPGSLMRTDRFVSAWDAILVLAGVTAFFSGLGAYVVSKREYVLNRAE